MTAWEIKRARISTTPALTEVNKLVEEMTSQGGQRPGYGRVYTSSKVYRSRHRSLGIFSACLTDNES